MDTVDDDEALSALQKIIRASEEVRFQASEMGRAVDDAEPGELPDSDRRHIKASADLLAAEAEKLLAWATAPSRRCAVN